MFARAQLCRLVAVTAGILAGPISAGAQGWIEPSVRSRPAPMAWQVSRVSTTIRATVEGRVARIEVEEQFRNNGGGMAEGTYHYPMAGEAVFQSLSLWMGEQEMRGELMDAAKARGIYEEIVRRRRDPALVTLAGHQLLRAQVFPIQPGETRKVVLRFTQVLDKQGDALRWRYALGPEERGSARPDIRVTLQNPSAFGRPFSPTHTVQVSGENDRIVSVTDASRGDVELFLPLQSTGAGLSVVTHAPDSEDGYFLMYVTPPEMTETQRMGRDLTMVVDVSGSMSGPKLEQAKAAIQQMLGTLSPRDRFRLISFSSGVRAFRNGFSAADPAALESARNWTNSLVADGGTNIEGALRDALRHERGDGSNRENLDVLVFLTDGVPSVGEQQPEKLAALAAQDGGRTRVFTVGIGVDVNTYLLERLAQDGRGAADFVPPNGNVEQTVGGLARKLRAPALVDLRVVSSPARIVSMEPVRLPDLFAGQEMVVLGRYSGGGSGPLVIEGTRDGQRVRVSTVVDFARHDADHEYVGTLWAARRIGALTRTMRLEGATEQRIEEIRTLALRHGIVTEYTAYLVLEPDRSSADIANAPVRRRSDGSQAPAAAPSSVQQTGRGAFEAAQTSADYATASNVGEAKKVSQRAQMRSEQENGASGGGRAQQRLVGSRRYEQRGAQWTDIGQRSQRVVTVEAFSAAYFALLQALPELRDASQLGDDVLVAGRRVSIRIQRTGQQTLAGNEVMQLAKDFRGA
jgi:Ca-activated chloride channel homolog